MYVIDAALAHPIQPQRKHVTLGWMGGGQCAVNGAALTRIKLHSLYVCMELERKRKTPQSSGGAMTSDCTVKSATCQAASDQPPPSHGPSTSLGEERAAQSPSARRVFLCKILVLWNDRSTATTKTIQRGALRRTRLLTTGAVCENVAEGKRARARRQSDSCDLGKTHSLSFVYWRM